MYKAVTVLVTQCCHLLVQGDNGFKWKTGEVSSIVTLSSLRVLSVYSKAHCDNILDPGLQLIVLLHRGDSFGGSG